MQARLRRRQIWTSCVLTLYAIGTLLSFSCGLHSGANTGKIVDPVLGELVICHGDGTQKPKQESQSPDRQCCAIHQGSMLSAPDEVRLTT